MILDKALDLKQQISSSFLQNRTKKKVYMMNLKFAAPPKLLARALTAPDIQETINGVGVSQRANGEHIVKVLTRSLSNVSPLSLSQHFGVDKRDIIIEHTGPISFKSPTGHHRPPFPGISVGHYLITAGTLGCFVENKSGKQFILSNNHVLANTDKGHYNDPILQPGKLDGGKKAMDVIAKLTDLVSLSRTKPNEMDAAIAILEEGLNPLFKINKTKKVNGTIIPANHLKVEKFGRTTGHTTGSITTRNLDLQVDYDNQLIDFQDQFEIKGGMKNGKRIMFCDGGDSGSLILERGSLKAVGLLFSGNDEGTTFATPIDEVLSAFSVKIL